MHSIRYRSIAAPALHGALTLAALLALGGCNRKHPDVPVTTEAALPVVRALVASIEAGNRDFFNHKLDSAAFVERSTRDMGLSGLERSVARTGLFGEINLGDFVVDDVDRGGKYRLLRLHTVDGETRALVRIITAAGELNYHDIVLGYRGRSNDVAVRDVFVYKTGDLMSRSFGTVFKDAIESEEHPASRRGPALVAALDTLGGLAKEGNLEEARAYFLTLPLEIRRVKVALELYLTLCGLESTEAYHKAIDEYLRYYPNDTGSAMLKVELDILEENHKGALVSIDNLDRIVGGDPYLRALRARSMAALGDIEGAAALAKQALDAEPDLAALYWPYIDLLIAQGKHADAVRMLTALEEKGGVEREKIEMEAEIKEQPGYGKFLASREYAAWRGK